MTIDRQNPVFYWKSLRLGDYCRFSNEAYGVELEQGDWRQVGAEQDKRQLRTKGAQAFYSTSFEIVFVRGGAEVSGTKEHDGESSWAFRSRIRDFIKAFAAQATIKTAGMNHGGHLGLTYVGSGWTGIGAITAGTSVSLTFNNNPVLNGTDIAAGGKVLWIASTGLTVEIVEIDSYDGINQATFVEFLNSYGAGAWVGRPLDWGVPGSWPEGELVFQRSSGSSDLFTAQVRFRFSDELEDSY